MDLSHGRILQLADLRGLTRFAAHTVVPADRGEVSHGAPASGDVLGGVQAFAAGAILTMLASTMLPEAYESGGALSACSPRWVSWRPSRSATWSERHGIAERHEYRSLELRLLSN